MKIKHIFLYLLFVSICLSANAQSNLTLYQSRLVPQSTMVNPGFIPKTKINIGLPIISGVSISFANAFSFDDVEAGITEFPNKLNPKNYFTLENSLDLLHVGLKIKQSYVSLSIQEKISAVYAYPRDLFRFAILGNGGELLGKRVDLDGFGINFNHYREYAISYARPITRKLTVGVRGKYLYGMENITTSNSKLGITTDDDPNKNYPIIIDGKIAIQTSGISAIFDNRTDDITKQFESTEGIINYTTGLRNTGYGADFGINFEPTKRLSFSAAFNDIGSITWRDSTRSLKNDEVSFSFEGIDFNEFFTGGSSDSAMAELQDSLNAAFELVETPEEYTTTLTPKVYAGVRFNLSKSHAIGATTFFQFVPGAIRPAFSVSYELSARKWLGLTASYTAMSSSYANLGVGLVARVRAIQFYLLTDNAFVGIFPEGAKNTSLRFGFNAIFGRKADNTFGKINL